MFMNKRLLIALRSPRRRLIAHCVDVVCWVTLGFILGIVCSCNVKNNPSETVPVQTVPVQENVLTGFEVRIINDHTNERLELTETLGQALSYIEEYSMHHDDLIAFDLSTGAKVDHRYEVRIGFSDYTYSNGTWKDTIYTSLSLKESEKYLNEHKAIHTDLVIYDLATGDKVASSD